VVLWVVVLSWEEALSLVRRAAVGVGAEGRSGEDAERMEEEETGGGRGAGKSSKRTWCKGGEAGKGEASIVER